MTNFVRAPNPIWYMVDHVGLPLNDEYYAFFLTNTIPYLPQAPFHDPDGTDPYNYIVQFQPSGTLPNDLYFNDELVYRIEIRHGNTQNDQLIWLIENFSPGDSGSSADRILTSENMLTNPQFADVYFNETVTYDTAGTYNIAPGWYLELTGIGTTTVTQTAVQGVNNPVGVGNPAYYLTFNSAGWTDIKLYQRFSNNGALYASGAVAVAFVASSTTSATQLTVSFVPSQGSPTVIMTNRTIAVGNFVEYKRAEDTEATSNTDENGNAYVDLVFSLPETGIISLTNLQFVGQESKLPSTFDHIADAPDYQEISYERMVDHEFNVYRDSILRKPKDSLLVGWNFGLNPWQFRTTAQTNVSANEYTADQTIIIQQDYVKNNINNNIAVGRASYINQKGGFLVSPVTAHNQFGILQWIDCKTIAPYWSNFVSKLSSMVNVYLSTTGATTMKFKLRLIYTKGNATPSVTSRTYPVLSWDEFDDPVFAASVGEIIPPNDPEYTYDLVIGGFNDFPFEQISLPQSLGSNTTLGIMVYTTTNMNQAIGDYVVFGDVSLVPNDFAIASNPKSYDQVLKECQFFYAKTFPQGVVPASNSSAGSNNAIGYIAQQNGIHGYGVTWQFPSILRVTNPNMSAYCPLAAGSTWYNDSNGAVSGVSAFQNVSDRSALVTNAGAAGDNNGNQVSIHAVADARLGIV